MPYKNILKTYKENSYYHIYSRGVNKTPVFLEVNDYLVFKYILKKYLKKDFAEKRIINNIEIEISANSVYSQVELVSYCLMNTHFHLIVKNIKLNGITSMMKRISNSYVKYFNNKYTRQGPLFQGGYRAVMITSDEQLIQVTRYIHLNPIKDNIVVSPENYKYTSYHNYIKNKQNGWLKLDPFIKKQTDFKNLVKYLPYV